MPLSQETINEQLALLATHRRTLAHLVQQAAEYGSEVFAPPQTASGISKARTEIRRIKAILRAEGVTVTDEPNETSSAYDTEPEALSKPTTSVRLKVFLCHSKIDKLNVRNLYQRLRADGFQPWLDEEELIGGQDWDAEIAQAVRESDVVLVCLSQNASNRTGYIHREIEYALDIADRQPKGTIFIIPLRLEECDVPQRLSRWHWINLFEERGYARLVQSLRHRATAKQNSSINLDELRNGRAWVSLPSQRPQQVPALQEPPPFQSRKRKDFGGSTTLQTSRAEGDYVTRANLEKNPVDNQPSVSRVSSFLYELRKRIVQSGEVSRGVSPSKKKSIYSFLKETILNVSFGERLLKIISSS